MATDGWARPWSSATSTSPIAGATATSRPSAGSTSASPAGSSLGIAGESGSGKSTLISTVLRLQPKSATVTGQVLVDGEDVLGDVVQAAADAALGTGQHRVPGRPARAEPAAADRGADRRADHRPRAEDQRAATWTVGSVSCWSRWGYRPARARSYPHQLSGGSAPARHDRHGPGVPTPAHRGRRAHHGPGRHGAGPGPEGPDRPGRRARPDPRADLPRPVRAGRRVPARRGHVRRADRGVRSRRRRVRAVGAPVLPRAGRRRSPGSATPASATHPPDCPATRPFPGDVGDGLLVRPALPGGPRRLHERRPRARRGRRRPAGRLPAPAPGAADAPWLGASDDHSRSRGPGPASQLPDRPHGAPPGRWTGST